MVLTTVVKILHENWVFEMIQARHTTHKETALSKPSEVSQNCYYQGKMTQADPDMALLCLRVTPINHKLPSPAELLLGQSQEMPQAKRLPPSWKRGRSSRDTARIGQQSNSWSFYQGKEQPFRIQQC